MNKDMINWGIIGCGNVCEVKSGPAFQIAENSSLVAVMRRNIEKAKDFAERHNVSRFYSKADELINDPEINAIYIATPPNTHAQYTIAALKAGKPVYVEKPMALNFEECKTMIEASEKYKTPLFVAYYRRFFPYFLKIKEIIYSKQLGELLTCNLSTVLPAKEVDYKNDKIHWHLIPEISGGGYFFDLACHQLDILDFLLGEIEEVSGFNTNRANIYRVEDTLSAALKFKCGALGACSWTYVGDRNSIIDRIEIIGTKGMITFSISAIQAIALNIEGKEQVFDFEKPKHVELPMIKQVTKSLLGENTHKSNMYSAAQTSWVIDKIMNRI